MSVQLLQNACLVHVLKETKFSHYFWYLYILTVFTHRGSQHHSWDLKPSSNSFLQFSPQLKSGTSYLFFQIRFREAAENYTAVFTHHREQTQCLWMSFSLILLSVYRAYQSQFRDIRAHNCFTHFRKCTEVFSMLKVFTYLSHKLLQSNAQGGSFLHFVNLFYGDNEGFV